MIKKTVRIATRASALAVWQAEHVRSTLLAAHPQLAVKLVPMTSAGDTELSRPLYKIGGKGLFIKTLEHSLLEGHADLAVHSMKDVPAQLADHFCLAAIMRRATAYDALVARRYNSLDELPPAAIIGTTSLRRRCQLLARRQDLQCCHLRGNLDTRLQQLDEDRFDAIVLACAGLQRLGYEQRITQQLPLSLSVPAAGQGAIGIECLATAQDIHDLLRPLHDVLSAQCIMAERALCQRLGADCHSPVGAYAENHTGSIQLQAVIGSPDGHRLLRGEACAAEATEVVAAVAEQLFDQGAQQLLSAARRWCHAH